MKNYILNRSQKKILADLVFLKRYGFYLAGGTALAIQLGHRNSKDLDFYTAKHFDSGELIKDFKKTFGELDEVSEAPDTLFVTFEQVELSFFRYPYKLIRPTIDYQTVELASSEDIAAMKMTAVRERGVKRDFIDIYFLIKRFGLKEILGLTQEKYPDDFNEQNYLDGLIYFVDADRPQKNGRRIYFYTNISWLEIKKGIEKAVKEYQLGLINK